MYIFWYHGPCSCIAICCRRLWAAYPVQKLRWQSRSQRKRPSSCGLSPLVIRCLQTLSHTAKRSLKKHGKTSLFYFPVIFLSMWLKVGILVMDADIVLIHILTVVLQVCFVDVIWDLRLHNVQLGKTNVFLLKLKCTESSWQWRWGSVIILHPPLWITQHYYLRVWGESQFGLIVLLLSPSTCRLPHN